MKLSFFQFLTRGIGNKVLFYGLLLCIALGATSLVTQPAEGNGRAILLVGGLIIQTVNVIGSYISWRGKRKLVRSQWPR